MNERVIVDTGPLVALLDKDEKHHIWAVNNLREITGPLLCCEPVLTEALFLLRSFPAAQDKVLEWVSRGSLVIGITISAESQAIRTLRQKFKDMPMSLADACLVRMAELNERSSIMTLDSDFKTYRKHRRIPISLIIP